MNRDPAAPPAPRAEPPPADPAARRFWWACALGAPPIAFAVASVGYPMAMTPDPLRDLALIALASVLEEFVFRGALQPALARAFERGSSRQGGALVSRANVVTSLLFAAFHLWRHPLAVAVGVFPISLVYGRARELSGRWWPAALLHLGFNVALYAASWLLAGDR